jgi:hypothetical protein
MDVKIILHTNLPYDLMHLQFISDAYEKIPRKK